MTSVLTIALQSLAPRMPQGRDGRMDGIMNDYKDSRKKLEQVRQRNIGEEMRIKERMSLRR